MIDVSDGAVIAEGGPQECDLSHIALGRSITQAHYSM
jgi:hypothetical protein